MLRIQNVITCLICFFLFINFAAPQTKKKHDEMVISLNSRCTTPKTENNVKNETIEEHQRAIESSLVLLQHLFKRTSFSIICVISGFILCSLLIIHTTITRHKIIKEAYSKIHDTTALTPKKLKEELQYTSEIYIPNASLVLIQMFAVILFFYHVLVFILPLFIPEWLTCNSNIQLAHIIELFVNIMCTFWLVIGFLKKNSHNVIIYSVISVYMAKFTIMNIFTFMLSEIFCFQNILIQFMFCFMTLVHWWKPTISGLDSLISAIEHEKYIMERYHELKYSEMLDKQFHDASFELNAGSSGSLLNKHDEEKNIKTPAIIKL